MNNGNLYVRSKRGNIYISTEDIIYCKAARRYTFIKTRRKMTKIASNIKSIENRLCKTKFVRIHRSHIVNLDFIKEYLPKTNEVVLTNDDKFSTSMRKRRLIQKIINTFNK